jgi:hypothetical protein
MLAYTDFGADLPELLRGAGFVTETLGEGVDVVFSSTAV